MADAVVEYGLPFFDSFRSTDQMLSRLREGKGLPGLTDPQVPLVHAMLALEAGARGEARELLEKAYSTADGSRFRETVQVIGARLGIPLG